MKRREFLASGVGAALWATGWPKGTRISRAHIRFGYAAITWGGNDARAIDDIAALGFRGIQLRQSAVTTWGDRPGELKQLLADRKLTLVALSSGDVSLDPAREHDILALHTRHARFVRDVGGRYLQVIDQRPAVGIPPRTTSSAWVACSRRSGGAALTWESRSAITITWGRWGSRRKK